MSKYLKLLSISIAEFEKNNLGDIINYNVSISRSGTAYHVQFVSVNSELIPEDLSWEKGIVSDPDHPTFTVEVDQNFEVTTTVFSR